MIVNFVSFILTDHRPSTPYIPHDVQQRQISYKMKLQEFIIQYNLPNPNYKVYGYQKSQIVYSRQVFAAKVSVLINEREWSALSGSSHFSADEAEEKAAESLYHQLTSNKDQLKVSKPISSEDSPLKEKIITNILTVRKLHFI